MDGLPKLDTDYCSSSANFILYHSFDHVSSQASTHLIGGHGSVEDEASVRGIILLLLGRESGV